MDRALKIVEKLEHRAGKDASGETGDGVGILVQISHRFFSAVLAELVWQKLAHQTVRINDFSAVVTGLLLGYLIFADLAVICGLIAGAYKA